MHIQKTLEQFGYRSNEIKVYLAVLQMGASTISEVAGRVKIPRTSVQLIITSLQEKGLINFFIKRKRKYWVGENPEKIAIELKEKEAALKTIMPQLQALRYDTGVKPTIRLYNGIDGIKSILDDIIETKRPIRSLTSMEDAEKLLEDTFDDFIEKRHARFLRVQFLTHRSPKTEGMKKRDMEELRHTRFLPDGFTLKNANFIYGDKVAIISLNKKLPVGTIIEDRDVAETQNQLFEYIWIHSKE